MPPGNDIVQSLTMNSRVSKNNRRKENHLKDTVIQLNRIDQARSVYDVITSVTLFQCSMRCHLPLFGGRLETKVQVLMERNNRSNSILIKTACLDGELI